MDGSILLSLAPPESARDKFRSLLDIIRAMQGEMGVNSLIFTITQRTIRVVEADRCTLFLVDNIHRGLFAMQGEVGYVYAFGVWCTGVFVCCVLLGVFLVRT
ncbi:hypothetical protein EON63_10365 [archaeon]|nr:MAG: hypothetical protein EON63_10365 [archaeon]